MLLELQLKTLSWEIITGNQNMFSMDLVSIIVQSDVSLVEDSPGYLNVLDILELTQYFSISKI